MVSILLVSSPPSAVIRAPPDLGEDNSSDAIIRACVLPLRSQLRGVNAAGPFCYRVPVPALGHHLALMSLDQS
eukprot:6826659-Alexandrium_andersonii.AAC.1